MNLAYNDAEYEIVSRAAARAGLAVAASTAKAALSVAAHDIAPLPASDTELLQCFQDADASFRDIGNTLNELARAAGSHDEHADPRLATVLEQVARAAMELMDASRPAPSWRTPRQRAWPG